jgi:hypothetical protein
VVDPVSRYYHVLSSLPQEAVRLVRHVLQEDTGFEAGGGLCGGRGNAAPSTVVNPRIVGGKSV